MRDVGQHAALAVVVAVVVGGGNEAYSHPAQLLEASRMGAGERAAGHAGRVLEIVYQHFEVGVADVRFIEQVSERQVARLVEHRQAAGYHSVAGRGECQVAGFRFVEGHV